MGNLLFILVSIVSIPYGSSHNTGASGDAPGGGNWLSSIPDMMIPADATTFVYDDDEFPFVFQCPLVTQAPGFADTALQQEVSYFVIPTSFEGREGLRLDFNPDPVRVQTYTRTDGSLACRAIIPAPQVAGLDPEEVVAQFSPGVFQAMLMDSSGLEVGGYESPFTIRTSLGVVIGNSANRTFVAGGAPLKNGLGYKAEGGCGVLSEPQTSSAKSILVLFALLSGLLFLYRLTRVQPASVIKP